MSDDEDFMMSDGDSYEFEFEESGDEEAVDQTMNDNESNDNHNDNESNDNGNGKGKGGVANDVVTLYDNGKAVKLDDPDEALLSFRQILDLENDGTRDSLNMYQFKAFKQTLKVLYKLNRIEEFLNVFDELAEFAHLGKLKRNYVDDSFSRMFDLYIGFQNDAEQLRFLDTLLTRFKHYTFNERLAMKINLRKTQVLSSLKRFDEVLSLLNELYPKLDQTIPEVSKNTYLLELYSIEIQVYTETDNISKLKELYNKTLSIQSTIPHPKIFAIIKECGGKMYLRDENYELATNEFYESFKNYDEIGNHEKRINILKYLIVSSILSTNEINKFESQETKYFLKDGNIANYIIFLKKFENLQNDEFNDIFKKIVQTETELHDNILTSHLYKVERIFKLKLLVHYIKPFKRLSLSKLSDKLQLPLDNIEDIMLNLKNNGELKDVKLDLIDGIIYNE
jgi:COP9 signalosome complex subunit 2